MSFPKIIFQRKHARLRRASRQASDSNRAYGNAYGNAMGTSGRTECSLIESTKGNGAPGEIRTPDPQIRSLGGRPCEGLLRHSYCPS